MENKRELLQKRLKAQPYFFLDGAMGTMLQQSGLKLGERPEALCLSHPEILTDIHRQYLESGSDMIYANTFGANSHKLAGTGLKTEEVVRAAVRAAKTAADPFGALVALDVGPIGELLEPAGTLTFAEAYALFREQAIAGEEAGADAAAVETMTDLSEVRAAVLAIRENTSLPVFVTMTFEENGRTFTGCSAAAMADTLTGLGVDALGINCSLGPREIFPIAREIAARTSLPVIVKANAGLPDPRDNTYSVTPELFAEQMKPYAELGVTIVGGCCGTTPAYIRALRKTMEQRPPFQRQSFLPAGVCTPSRVVELDGVHIIGERINPTGKKRFQQALREGDLDYIAAQGVEQAEAGADILDVNVGLPGVDEPAMMERVVRRLQSVLDLPLQIDSSDPAAIESGLRACTGVAIVNSVNGETEVLERILPIVRKYGAFVVGLTLDSKGIPQTAEERLAIAGRILEAARRHGIPREKVLIDCLTLTVSAQQAQAAETLRAVRMVREQLGLRTVLGVSNISFGLPNRELLNHSFLSAAMENGLNLPIINPNIPSMTAAVAAFNVLHGYDRDSARYLARFSRENVSPAAQVPAGGHDLAGAVKKGLREEAKLRTKELLEIQEPLDIIDGILIPALDAVGADFEKGTLFLPQLINAAGASQEAFAVIKERIASSGGASVSKGKVILATVKGDIHDIGKNIVKVLLENYGYRVIDLGRDVPPERVVETAVREDVKLVGLSALMTTTLRSMEETIRQLRRSGHDCKVMAGGAVLTESYAMEIGADYYARDAKRSADIAREVLG
ncbi:MAG: homocysteine S-methyltransferase family protein [Candidatus Merdivicinus sp.]